MEMVRIFGKTETYYKNGAYNSFLFRRRYFTAQTAAIFTARTMRGRHDIKETLRTDHSASETATESPTWNLKVLILKVVVCTYKIIRRLESMRVPTFLRNSNNASRSLNIFVNPYNFTSYGLYGATNFTRLGATCMSTRRERIPVMNSKREHVVTTDFWPSLDSTDSFRTVKMISGLGSRFLRVCCRWLLVRGTKTKKGSVLCLENDCRLKRGKSRHTKVFQSPRENGWQKKLRKWDNMWRRGWERW